MKLLILNGPNLNKLGTREPNVYGTDTYEDLKKFIQNIAKSSKIKIKTKQSNYEGKLIDLLHKSEHKFDFVILNAGGYTHTSVALADAIKSINTPVIEVHLSDVDHREDYRKINFIREACIASFYGKGFKSYQEAIEYTIRKGA